MGATESFQAFTLAAVLFGSGFVTLHYYRSRVRRMIQERENRIVSNLSDRIDRRMASLVSTFASQLPPGFVDELRKVYVANIQDELTTMREEWLKATDPRSWSDQLTLFLGGSCALVVLSGIVALTIYETYWTLGVLFGLVLLLPAIYYAVRIEISD
jgi:hypothetical protein